MPLISWNAQTAAWVSVPNCPSIGPGQYFSAASRRCTDLTSAPVIPTARVRFGATYVAVVTLATSVAVADGAALAADAVTAAGLAEADGAARAVPAVHPQSAMAATAAAVTPNFASLPPCVSAPMSVTSFIVGLIPN